MDESPAIRQRALSTPPGPWRRQANYSDQPRPEISRNPISHSSFGWLRNFNFDRTQRQFPRIVMPSIMVGDEAGAFVSPPTDHQRRSTTVVDCASQTSVVSDDSPTNSQSFNLIQENVNLKVEVERETGEIESLKQRNQSLTVDFNAKETELHKEKQKMERRAKRRDHVLFYLAQLEDSVKDDGRARGLLEKAAHQHRIELNQAKSRILSYQRKEADQEELTKRFQEENAKLRDEKAALKVNIRGFKKDAKLAVEWKEKGRARISDIAKANENLQTRIRERNTDNITLCKRIEELASSYATIEETLNKLSNVVRQSQDIDLGYHTHLDTLVTAHRELGEALNISPPSSKTSTTEGSLGTPSSSRRTRRSHSVPAFSSTASTRSAESLFRLLDSPRPAERRYPFATRAQTARLSRLLDKRSRNRVAFALNSPQFPIIRYGEDATIEDQHRVKSLSAELEEIGEGLDDLPDGAYIESQLRHRRGSDASDQQQRLPAAVSEAGEPIDERHTNSTETTTVTGVDSVNVNQIQTTIPSRSAMMSISIEPQLPADSGQLPLANMGVTDHMLPLSETTIFPLPRSPVLSAPQIDQPVSGPLPVANVSGVDQLLPVSENAANSLPQSPVPEGSCFSRSSSKWSSHSDSEKSLSVELTEPLTPFQRARRTSDHVLGQRCLEQRIRRAICVLLALKNMGMLPNPNYPPSRLLPNPDSPAKPKASQWPGWATQSHTYDCRNKSQWKATVLPRKSAAHRMRITPVSPSNKQDPHAHRRITSKSKSLGDTGGSFEDGRSSLGLNNGSSGSQSPQVVKLEWFGPDDERTGSSNCELRLSKKSSRALSQDEIRTKTPLVPQPSIRINLPPLQVSSKAQQIGQPSEIARAHQVLPAPTGDRNNIWDTSEPESYPLMISHNIRGQNQEADSTPEPSEPPVDPVDMTATASSPGAESEDEPVEDDLLHIADLLDMKLDEDSTLSVLVLLQHIEQNPDDTWLARLQATSVMLESGPGRKEAIRNMFEDAIMQLMKMDANLTPEKESLQVPAAADAASNPQAQESPISQASGPERRETIRKMFEDATSNINAMESDESTFSPTTTGSNHSDPEDGELVLHSLTAPGKNSSESALVLRPVRHLLGPSHLAGALRYHVKRFIASTEPRRWEMTFHPSSLALTPASGSTFPERFPVDDGHVVGRIEQLQEDEAAPDTDVSTNSEVQPTRTQQAGQEQTLSLSAPINAKAQWLSGPISASNDVQHWTPGAEPQRAKPQGPTLLQMSRHVAVLETVLAFLRIIVSIPVRMLNWLYELARNNQLQTFSWLLLFMCWMVVCDRAQMWYDANDNEYRNEEVRTHNQETWGHPALEKLTFRVIQWLDLTQEFYGL